MVLAAWVKKKQLRQGIEIGMEQGIEQGKEIGIEQGIEQGKEIGRAEERKRANAKMRAWAKDAMEAQQQGKPIPFNELPLEDEPDGA